MVVLGTEPKALCMLSTHSTAELYAFPERSKFLNIELDE